MFAAGRIAATKVSQSEREHYSDGCRPTFGRALIVDDNRDVSASLVLAFRVLGVRATSDHLVKPIDLEDIERVLATIKK